MIKQDTKVKFDYQGVKGTGIITGIYKEICLGGGGLYIIQSNEKKLCDDYPYSCFVCPQSNFIIIE